MQATVWAACKTIRQGARALLYCGEYLDEMWVKH